MGALGEVPVAFDAAKCLEADLGRERALAFERFAELVIGGLEFVSGKRGEASLKNVDSLVDLRREFVLDFGFDFADACNEPLHLVESWEMALRRSL